VQGIAGRRAVACSFVLAVGIAASLIVAGPSKAATASALLYDYEFAGTTGSVPNSAPGGLDLPLTLTGTWSPAADGVHFSGDTIGDRSVAYAVPSSGYSLNEPASASVGFGARVVYDSPTSGTCFGDTPNITQIGRFAAKTAQAKIQLSKCADDKTGVAMECRFAGALTPSNVFPVISTLALVSGDAYDVSCTKSPDVSGEATITLSVSDLTVSGATVTNTFQVAALGAMKSTQAISAGNKYPMPAPAKNTDQFVGDVTRAVYCAGAAVAVSSCLATYLPLK
jgi:hypothetical protein